MRGAAGILICLVLSLPPAAAGRAQEQGTSPSDTTARARGTSPSDTAAQAQGASPRDTSARAADTTAAAAAVDRFKPANNTYIRTNEDNVTLGNNLTASYEPGNGWVFTNALAAEQRRYRTQKITDVMQSLSSQAIKTVPGMYIVNAGVGHTYSKKKTLGLGRFGKDIVFDNQMASASYSLLKPLLESTSSQLTFKAEGRQGTNDFKYDRALTGSMSGSVRYSIGNLVSAGGGFGASRRVESSEVGDTTFASLPSNSDTIRASLSYGSSSAKVIELSYMRSGGIERKIMPPLGNSLEILDDPSAAQREEAHQRQEQLAVKSSIAPFGFMSFDMQFSHSLNSQRYSVDQRRSGEMENTSINAAVNYRYAKRGSAKFGVTSSESVNDYGAKSLSSFTERDFSLSAGLSQVLLDSLVLTANGMGRLKQRFYKLRDVNPRDADYLYYRADGTLRAKLLPRVWADVTALVDRYETINIDASLSGDNRVDYQYRLGPTLRLKPLKWLSLTQDYIVKIEFTDFVFTEDKNYLNRTTTLNTRAEMAPTRRSTMLCRYSYIMKDAGSYLRRGDRELYSPNNRNVEHSLGFDVRYTVVPEFTVKAQADFRTQESSIYGMVGSLRKVVRTTVYESGGMKVGFMRRKQLWNAGTVDLDVAYARNYGAYITEARKEYWEANSAINLKF